MSINEMLLPEFDQEMATTRRLLERVPEEKPDWAPHQKSMTMGRLSSHLAETPEWTAGIIREDSFDIAPPDGQAYKPAQFDTKRDLLAAFDKNVATARESLAGATDETLMGNWSMLAGGKTMFTMPRLGVIRTWVLNHTIHHRAQLGVYLRLNDIPVPSVYGPSADEGQM